MAQSEAPKPQIAYCAMTYVCPTYLESRCCQGCLRYDKCRSRCANSPDRCGLYRDNKKDLNKSFYEVYGRFPKWNPDNGKAVTKPK